MNLSFFEKWRGIVLTEHLVRLTDHHSRRHGIPFEPECDEGAGYQNNARDENRGKVEGAIPREDQIHLQAAVITWVTHTQFHFPCWRKDRWRNSYFPRAEASGTLVWTGEPSNNNPGQSNIREPSLIRTAYELLLNRNEHAQTRWSVMKNVFIYINKIIDW